jgi:hypothetical protein
MSWESILERVEAVYVRAEENYRLAVALRSGELRAQGAQFERAYEAITDAFRESWHGFALRLKREGNVQKEGVSFHGVPPAPIIAEWRGRTYTVQVFPTGSILVLTGDKRHTLSSQ